MTGIFIPNQENYGINKISDAGFLSDSIGIGSLINGVTRPMWGLIYDRVEFKYLIRLNYAVQTFICITLPFVS